LETLRSPGSVHDLPAFADIPSAGRRVAAGRPILTFFARGDSVEACRDSLQTTAADLDRWIFGA
jgi:predicted ATP-grasp superfamily ATP-dependent carboligase